MSTTPKPLPGCENSSESDAYLMELLMSGTSSLSNPETSTDSFSAISSPVLVAGVMPCDLLDGQIASPSGPEVAPVSHSAQPEKVSARKTRVTFGRSSVVSSASADLQKFMESRLRQRLDVNGSMEYALTWKHWPMQTVPPICALRGSGRRISDNDCSGWPTPRTPTGGPESAERKQELGRSQSGGGDLASVALLSGWPTPDSQAMNVGANLENHMERMARMKEKHNNGNGAGLTLGIVSQMVSGWATPTSRDHKDSTSEGTAPVNGLLGRQVWGTGTTSASSPASTENRGALNPAFSLWLMGYPIEWDSCGEQAMQSFRKSRQRSSKPQSTPA